MTAKMAGGLGAGAPVCKQSAGFSQSARIFRFRRGPVVDPLQEWLFAGGMDLMVLDIFLRGGVVILLVMTAVLFACSTAGRRKALSVVTTCAGLIAYLLVSSRGIILPSGDVANALILIAGTVPVLVYWAASELFQDDFDVRPWQVGLGLAIIASAWGAMGWPMLGTLRGLLVLALLGHLLFVVISGRSGDLIDARRRFRNWFVAAIIALTAVITLIEITQLDRGLSDGIVVLHAGVFLGLTATFLLWAIGLKPDIWVTGEIRPRPRDISPVQAALIAKVEAAMAEGLWQQEGLSISDMARALGTQDHKLRQTINQHLGHRNFASFINQYRIEAAKNHLSDPNAADQTVLSIAYEVGFASLGPFNRAFRAQTGMSPTEFRKSVLAAD